MAIQIPEYVASQELDTDRRGMPHPDVASGLGEGLQKLGASLESLSAHMQARQDQKDQTTANYAFEDLRMRAQEHSADVLKSAPVDGSGIHDNTVSAIQTDADKVLAKMPASQQEEFKHRVGLLVGEHSIKAADNEYSAGLNYDKSQVQKFTNNATADLTSNPDNYKAHKEDLFKTIDGLARTTTDKQALKDWTEEQLAKGKIEGVMIKDPGSVKAVLGIEAPNKKASYSAPSGTSSVKDYIVQAAKDRGIDPNVALRVASAEGGLHDPYNRSKVKAPSSQDPSLGSTENSYGPFQLYISGKGAGLGDRAVAAGVNPQKDWKAGIDFALNEVKRVGWGQWYGAKAAGVGNYDGITRDGKTYPVSKNASDGHEASSSVAVDPAYANMPLEWKIQKANQADALMAQVDAANQTQAKATVAGLSNDSLSSFRSHGEAQAEPTIDQFMTANPKTGVDDYNKYQNDKTVAMKTHAMQSMTADELNKVVSDARKAIGSGKGADMAENNYNALSTEANQLKAAQDQHAREAYQPVKDFFDEHARNEAFDKAAASAEQAQKNKDAQHAIDAYQPVVDMWKQYMDNNKAQETAALALQKERADSPFKYVMDTSPQIRAAYINAQQQSAKPEELQKAMMLNLEEQKRLGIENEKIQIIPPEVAAKVASTWGDDTVPSQKKQASVMSLINMVTDDKYKFVVFNQLKDQGLPAILQGAISASIDKREPGAVNRLFEAANMKSKDANITESDAKVNQAAYDALSTGTPAVHYGLASGSTLNYDRMSSDAQLVSKEAKMLMVKNGISSDEAIPMAVKDLLGNQNLLDTTLPNGPRVSVILPDNADTRVLSAGFETAADKVKYHLGTMLTEYGNKVKEAHPDMSDGQMNTARMVWEHDISSHMSDSTFVAVNGGYAIQNNSTGILVPDGFNSKNPLIFSSQDITDMGHEAITANNQNRFTKPAGTSVLDMPMGSDMYKKPKVAK